MKTLIVEDDFTSRLILQTFLSRFGECHVAVTGREAVDAFKAAVQSGQGYDLICMDLMMPDVDGREAVKQVRQMEQARGIPSTAGVKIIMTTAMNDIREMAKCYNELCDSYLVKPINLAELLKQVESYHLVH